VLALPQIAEEQDVLSGKREFVARVFPNGIPFLDVINDNAKFVAVRRDRFSACPEFEDRPSLYRHVADIACNAPIDYLEFGVWQGASIRAWSELNNHPDSSFYGFDTFRGLPEEWDPEHPKGTFSTEGKLPQLDDHRIRFIEGLFQDTLRPFLVNRTFPRRLVVNVDCDIYSATLFVLGTLDVHFKPGTIIIFDDFYSMQHEFKAFVDYNRSFGRKWQAIGRTRHCTKAAIQILE
jgi:O-methyltransferase